MIRTNEKNHKILVNEDKLLGIRSIGRPIGVKVGVPALVCYLRGTCIRTPEGERRIEELKIGDPVVTISGESKPIKWIGRQRFKKSGKCWPKDFEPIRISRFALDERTPHRDLCVSPNHAIYIDGVLIPAKYLINGINITQCAPEGADIIEYLHIELFAHDVIYAEGATAETFGSRREARDHFDNFYEYYPAVPQRARNRASSVRAAALGRVPVREGHAAFAQCTGAVDGRAHNTGQNSGSTCCARTGLGELIETRRRFRVCPGRLRSARLPTISVSLPSGSISLPSAA